MEVSTNKNLILKETTPSRPSKGLDVKDLTKLVDRNKLVVESTASDKQSYTAIEMIFN